MIPNTKQKTREQFCIHFFSVIHDLCIRLMNSKLDTQLVFREGNLGHGFGQYLPNNVI